MICFRCLFGEEGKSKGEIDLSFYGGAAHVVSHNGLIIPVHRQGGDVQSKCQGCVPSGADVHYSPPFHKIKGVN